MSATQANWLQVYVDAVMEKDPYKRLALVRKLKDMPKNDLASGPVDVVTDESRVRLINTKPATSAPAMSVQTRATPPRVASRKVTPVKKSKSARRR